jgi:hypothetical protein
VVGVEWTITGRRSFNAVIDFVAAQQWGDPIARRDPIERAVEQFRDHPRAGFIVGQRGSATLRAWIVESRFIVYYMYLGTSTKHPNPRISIRYIRHVLELQRTRGVREMSAYEYCGRRIECLGPILRASRPKYQLPGVAHRRKSAPRK